jgi:hypothetical protein
MSKTPLLDQGRFRLAYRSFVGWAKARSRRAHHFFSNHYVSTKVSVGTRSLSSGAHSRDPLALPTLHDSGTKRIIARTPPSGD